MFTIGSHFGEDCIYCNNLDDGVDQHSIMVNMLEFFKNVCKLSMCDMIHLILYVEMKCRCFQVVVSFTS